MQTVSSLTGHNRCRELSQRSLHGPACANPWHRIQDNPEPRDYLSKRPNFDSGTGCWLHGQQRVIDNDHFRHPLTLCIKQREVRLRYSDIDGFRSHGLGVLGRMREKPPHVRKSVPRSIGALYFRDLTTSADPAHAPQRSPSRYLVRSDRARSPWAAASTAWPPAQALRPPPQAPEPPARALWPSVQALRL